MNPRKNIIAVDTTDEKTVKTLLGLSQLCGVNTRAYIPQGADVTAGVISDVDLELQDDVLKSMIVCTPPCKIISARRLGSSKCVKILFDCAKLPSHIKAGLVRYPVRPFVPRPLQCRKCLKLGHVQGFCTSAVVCARCGQNHDVNSCDSPTSRCPNCTGEHLATDKECPTLKKKLNVLKEKAKKKASGKHPSSRSARPAATNGKNEDVPARSKNTKDTAHRPESGKRNFCLSAISWPALPSKASEPVTAKITPPKASEPAPSKASSTVEKPVNRVPTAVSVNDDEQLINLLKMLVKVVRSLIAGRQTPAALAAEQLLEALVPVLDGLH